MAMKVTETQLARDGEKGVVALKLLEVGLANGLINKNLPENYSDLRHLLGHF